MTFEEFWHPLRQRYDEREARAVARWLLEVSFGLAMPDILCGALERLPTSQITLLQTMRQQLLEGLPVQYVAGLADFGPRQFIVAPGVLIPRPETYELCQWIVEEDSRLSSLPSRRSLLDIGTGSGCIACTLAAELPETHVSAWDISPAALEIARRNALRHQVDIDFRQCDILDQHSRKEEEKWDIIVSNPPYICDQEASAMEAHVLDYEPDIALFVPDDDPLRFYHAIGSYARSSLCENGHLYFEINPLYAVPLQTMLAGLGFEDLIIRKDQFGKDRMLRCTLLNVS